MFGWITARWLEARGSALRKEVVDALDRVAAGAGKNIARNFNLILAFHLNTAPRVDMPKRNQKYRPGIDDPPPTFLLPLAGAIGLTAATSFLVALIKRAKSR